MTTERRWASLVVLCASLLMVGMDLTVLHVAVPTISRDLLPSAAEMLWIADGYALAVAAGLISCGTLGDRFGRKRVLVAGFAVFGLASGGAAFAESAVLLVVARVVLGVGGAMIMSSTPAIIRVIFPDGRERGIALGLWVAAYSVGVSAGPLLGGLLIEHWWWGSVFVINVPIAVAAVVGGLVVVPESRNPRPHRWDALGAVLSAFGLAAVVYALQRFGEGTVGVQPVVVAAGTGLLVGFVVRQRRIGHPLVDLSLFGDLRFSLAALCVAGCNGAYVGLLFLLTQRLQVVDGHSPLEAGVALAPLAVANAVGAALASRFGHRRGLAGGMLLLAVAFASFGVVGSAGSYAALVVAGLGSGVVMTVGSDVMLGAARPERAGEVGAVQETSFSLGAGLGLAFLGTTLSLVYRSSFGDVPGATREQWETARDSLGAASELAASVGGRTGEALLSSARQAFETAFSAAAAIAGALLAVLAVSAGVFLRPPRGVPKDEEAAAKALSSCGD